MHTEGVSRSALDLEEFQRVVPVLTRERGFVQITSSAQNLSWWRRSTMLLTRSGSATYIVAESASNSMQQSQRTMRHFNSWQSKATSNVVPASRAFITAVGPPSRRHSAGFLQAVRLAREQQFDDAREVFAQCTMQQPGEEIAWVSWAQMEKRTEAMMAEAESPTRRFARSRAVLQQGLQLNPHSARICQAWGLLELQAGNTWAALALLERATRADARCAPVLRWQPVQAARLAVSQRRQHVSRSKLAAKLRSIS